MILNHCIYKTLNYIESRIVRKGNIIFYLSESIVLSIDELFVDLVVLLFFVSLFFNFQV